MTNYELQTVNDAATLLDKVDHDRKDSKGITARDILTYRHGKVKLRKDAEEVVYHQLLQGIFDRRLRISGYDSETGRVEFEIEYL